MADVPDLVYLLLMLAFFALCGLIVRGAERL